MMQSISYYDFIMITLAVTGTVLAIYGTYKGFVEHDISYHKVQGLGIFVLVLVIAYTMFVKIL